MKPIHYINIALLLLAFNATVYAQTDKPSKQTVALNKEIFKIIKKNSLYSNQLNWKEMEMENKALPLTENDSISEQMIYAFFKNKLREVGDKHSFFISAKSIDKIKIMQPAENPEGEYINDGIAWIKVPRCLMFDETKELDYANSIRSIIEKIDTENTILGWIVDLRHNTGGSMWPMLAGLNALIDDGTAGYFVDGKKKSAWLNENGKILGKKKNLNTYKVKNNKVKIAVLIDGRTGSSGEMTAISFLGLPNVQTFGQTSAGYTTANYTFDLPNGGQFLLAKTYVMDRKENSYKHQVEPMVVVNDLSNTKNDEVIKTAKKWLLE